MFFYSFVLFVTLCCNSNRQKCISHCTLLFFLYKYNTDRKWFNSKIDAKLCFYHVFLGFDFFCCCAKCQNILNVTLCGDAFIHKKIQDIFFVPDLIEHVSQMNIKMASDYKFNNSIVLYPVFHIHTHTNAQLSFLFIPFYWDIFPTFVGVFFFFF